MQFEEYIVHHQTRGTLPGLVIAHQHGYADPVIHVFGQDGNQHPLLATSIFPVASITKLALAIAVLRLGETKQLELTASVGAYCDDIHPSGADRTIASLLCHCAGYALDLPDKEGRYARGLSWPALAQECLATAPATPAWHQVQYSNLGYGILGVVVERITRWSCAEALQRLVFQPLGIQAWLGVPPAPFHTAQIGDVRGRHTGTELETFNSHFWQSLALPWGGLCTDVTGALTLVRAFLPHTGFLSAEYCDIATSDHTRQLPGGFMPPLTWPQSPWGLGPERRGTKHPHWVDSSFPAHSYGHSGASGMLVWSDPDHLLSVAILGARAADGGWLLRHGPTLTRLVRQMVLGA
jgi:beta-lactamase class C